MRWLVTFLLGVAVGAGGLFVYLREIADAPDPIVTDGGALPAPAGGPPAPAPAATGSDSGLVQTDLSEADLPIRPAPHVASNGTTAPELSAGGSMPAKLLVPVEGVAYSQLTDTFDQPRGQERHHEALDIMAPKGTPVRAVADGKVAKLFQSKPGGVTLYQFDPNEQHAYYYAHLDRYADGIKEGMQLKRGDLIGYVGVSGNADPNAPHLHFAVVALTPEKQWWKGTPVNPYPLMGD
ncbi:M23 family metallopeptidase [Massilia sp. Dwa41.01b]|uniref:M23 family metallopeptidase n=1 Tax=unclassified Massilia TaxID=2609279 RepID=UPI0016039D83|nr:MULTISPECIES: M23 family metallopeptidase [unclassified Massilia]QNA88638.1 M23 family metallopeptidase [Massilia sp. Dwa41.01b]QNA99528.1 M23 family metallopeptidase [Massilia sp. Se16.2.3]